MKTNPVENCREIKVAFRFPVEQIDQSTVVVKVPIGGSLALIRVNPDAVEAFKLSDAECDKVHDAAFEAAIRVIMIKE